MIVGKRIRHLRLEKKFSQSELAKKCSIDRKTIVRIENNQVSPRINVLLKILKTLEISPKQFF